MENELNQVEQIDSVLENLSNIDSELDNISQIDSVLGNVIVIANNFIYIDNVNTDDWVQDVNQYTYTIQKESHKLSNPCLIKFDVYHDGVYENAFVSYTVNSTGDVTFKVDEPVTAIIKLEGEA